MTAYYLVQRLTRKTTFREKDRGIDGEFTLEYMGSSEFEFGAAPRSLKRMRATKAEVTERTVRLHGKDHVVFFVSDPGTSDAKWDFLQKWVDDGLRGKEWTNFDTMLESTNDGWRTDAWWSLEEDVAWALTRDHAEAFAHAVNKAPVKA